MKRLSLHLAFWGLAWVAHAFAEISTIYVAPMSHTDIGFTAPPSEVADKMEKSAALALDRARSDPAYVWNFEGLWQLEQWLNRHDNHDELLALLKSGRFGLSASYANPHTSLMSAWALDQNFRVPTEWARSHGITLDWAVLNDVPGHPIDLPRFLAANGVKYLAVGSNQSLSQRLPEEVSHTPFWWEGPDGSRVLVWISAKEAYVEAYTLYGIDPGTAKFMNPSVFKKGDDLEVMKLGISGMLKYYGEKKYPFDSVLALHAFDNWGSEPSQRIATAAEVWNSTVGSPRIVVCSPGEFFRHIESVYGHQLPIRRGAWGMQWEPVRMATPSAMRRARAFEDSIKTQTSPNPDDIRRLLVYWEHSFGMGPPWPGLLTRDEAVLHNREQWDLVRNWPLPAIPEASGLPVEFPRKGFFDDMQTNGLYLADTFFHEITAVRRLPKEAWLSRSALRGNDGVLRIRHKVARRELGARASVVWSWKLSDADAQAPVILKTASGEMTLPDDGLAGYTLNYWVVISEFRIGRTVYRPHGSFVFSRPRKFGNWLVAWVVEQSLDAELKGGRKERLTFDEAYPGEEEVCEFGVDILSLDASAQ